MATGAPRLIGGNGRGVFGTTSAGASYPTPPAGAAIDAELDKFSMNAGSAPERIGKAHIADQPTVIFEQIALRGADPK